MNKKNQKHNIKLLVMPTRFLPTHGADARKKRVGTPAIFFRSAPPPLSTATAKLS